MTISTQLASDEYHEYYGPYIAIIGEVELLEALEDSADAFEQMIINLPVEKLEYSYQSGKWTIAQIILHLIDAERVFQYRTLRFSRNDMTDLPGFDQDEYITDIINDKTPSKKELLEAFSGVRESSYQLFKGLSNERLLRKGTANGTPMSVRAIGFMLSGHVRHHMKIINERYL